MLGNRNSQHKFSVVPDVKMARSQFDRSFAVKDTIEFDLLTPIFCDEILPGDTINLQTNAFARLATQKVPIMDNMYCDFFFFFVPSRLVWNNWEKFNGAQDNPGDSTDYVIPIVTTDTTGGAGEVVGSLYDHFGIPTQVPGLQVNALPFRAFNLIWNEWFRDENLQNRLPVPKDDGPDPRINYINVRRGRRHDYFTSALPWPQKGVATEIPITGAGIVTRAPNAGPWKAFQTGTNTAASAGVMNTNGSGELNIPATYNLSLDPQGGLIVNTASAATINSLRQAFSIQSLHELDARGGTRYVEILQAHFNVVSPDFRLQRPEYLGGGQTKINSHPVAQTSPTSGTDAQGALSAFATMSTSGANVGFSKSFVEHGYVIGLICPRADITYQQGLKKMWSRKTRFDFFWPKLQELGEQSILNKEIYAQGTVAPTVDSAVFGYQERYAEYRYMPSEIHGQFRSTYAQSLDFWHMAEEFGGLPTLADQFITQFTPIQRAIAVPSEPALLLDLFYKYNHARPIMSYGVPSVLGRF